MKGFKIPFIRSRRKNRIVALPSQAQDTESKAKCSMTQLKPRTLARGIIEGFILSLAIAISHLGCGYSAKGLLPSYIKTVYVKPFANNTYESRLETDFTTELIDRFINDGNLKVAREEDADLVVSGELVEFRREPLRHDVEREVEEYRIVILCNVKVEDRKREMVMWEEQNFGGDTSYFTTGAAAKTEASARDNAISDLTRRIVNRTVEDW